MEGREYILIAIRRERRVGRSVEEAKPFTAPISAARAVSV